VKSWWLDRRACYQHVPASDALRWIAGEGDVLPNPETELENG
jgi:hypothetical protein